MSSMDVVVPPAPPPAAPSSDDAEWKVMEVEACLAAAAALLFFQLLCGSFRRRSNNFFIQRGLWLGYTLLIPLTSYTLGLMQSSQVKTGMYPVWALSLFLIGGGANSITAYEIDDNKQWMRRAFNVLQIYVYNIMILRQSPKRSIMILRQNVYAALCFVPTIILNFTVISSHLYGVYASYFTNDTDDSKRVADYMKYNNARTPSGGQGNSQQELDPGFSIHGRKFLVLCPGYKVARGGESSVYRCELQMENALTLDQIWEAMGSEDWFISHGLSSKVKGVCLSFSLSHLLKCRFYGLNCAESRLLETRWLLSENNNDENTEAFRVIEAELGFLYDFFYTKNYVIFRNEAMFFLVASLKIIFTLVLGVCMLYGPPVLETRGNTIYRTQRKDVIITVGVLGAFVIVETLQLILYQGSDWAMVSLGCSHVMAKSPYNFLRFSIRKRLWLLIRKPIYLYWQHNWYWQNKLGQYSIIEGSQFLRDRKVVFLFDNEKWASFKSVVEYFRKCWANLVSTKGLHYVQLPETLKPDIVSLLKSNSDGHVTNGNTSLQRNGVFDLISSTLQDETTQTEKMLIWHIATEYCRIVLSDEARGYTQFLSYKQNREQEVTTKLSRYSAYLMSEAPELLPGRSVDTKFLFDHTLYEAREALGSKNRDGAGLLKALSKSIREHTDDTIFAKGLKLGRKLASIEDGSHRWKVMAEFWIETILYVAPSDNTKAHMERLAQGGEFLTHLWALLTHAGILTRSTPAEGIP